MTASGESDTDTLRIYGNLSLLEIAGRGRREEYDRTTPTGSVHEAIGTDYDEAGRVIAQGAMKQSGSAWTRTGTDIDTAVMHYNAFDEITERGLNDVYAEQFSYDQASRLIRTNSGDGVWKHFLYDKNGNQTLAVTSDGTDLGAAAYDTMAEIITAFGSAAGLGTTYVNGIVTTITTYDARGLALSVREPQRELSATGTRQTLVTSRVYNAFGDITSETDANGATVDYTYNTMGRRIKTESPTVSITLENGTAQNVRPTENYYYDASGRLVASRDANNNLTRLELLAGTGFGGGEALVTRTTTADGAFTEVKYDIHGDARTMIDQISRSTTQTYDQMGRVTQVNHSGGLIDYYQYDGLGQQIRHYNNFLGTSMAETTLYDQQGRIQQQIAMSGETTSYAYTWSGTLATSGLGTFGGWTETTTYANGKTLTEKTDVFGHSTYKNDLGSNVYNYAYDAAGRLASSAATGATISYTYLNTNKMSTITQGSVVTTYGYDKTGNLTSEVLKDGTTVLSSQSSIYDALGRISTWAEAGGTTAPAASMTYKYDANGNIRNTVGVFHTLNAQGEASSGSSTQDYWYRYDALNRVVTQKGILSGTQIYRGDKGTDIFYDAAGQRTYTLTTSTNTYIEYTGGGLPPENPEIPSEGEGDWVWHTDVSIHREDYDYDTAGRLDQVNAGDTVYTYAYGLDEILSLTEAQKNALSANEGAKRADFDYDTMGRQTRQRDYAADGTTVVFDKTTVYHGSTADSLNKGKIYYEDTAVKRGNDIYLQRNWSYYAQDMFNEALDISKYALGAVTHTLTQNFTKNTSITAGNIESASATTTAFTWFDGATQGTVTYLESINSTGGPAGGTVVRTSVHNYDAFGTMTSANITDGRSRTVTYTNNGAGQVIRRDEADGNTSTGDPHEVWYRYGGKEMGYVGNNGTTDTNYATSITSRTSTASTTAFRNGTTTGSSYVDFDQSLSAINSYDQGSAAGSYTVRAGDTLSSIAASVWGDSSLWYKIAEANGMTGQNSLIEGTSLRLPVGVIKNTHNASTFQPYDPAETVGDTAPTTPKPPKKNKCGVFGQVLLVVVAVVVSIYTAGAATGVVASALGTTAGAGTAAATAAGIAGGAIGGAAGSIASQAVGVATGIQDKFSWTSVATSALAGGLGAGASGDTWIQAAKNGLTNSIVSQGLSIALGPQKKFDWAGIAAAGVSAGFGKFVDGKVNGSFGAGRVGTAAQTGVVATASSIANAATRTAINGSSFGDNLRASIPDIIGQSIASAIIAAPKQQAEENPVTASGGSSLMVEGLGPAAPLVDNYVVAGDDGVKAYNSDMAAYNDELAAYNLRMSKEFAESGIAMHEGLAAARSAMDDMRNPLVMQTVTVTGHRPGFYTRYGRYLVSTLSQQASQERSGRAAYSQRYYGETAQWRSNLADVQGKLAFANAAVGGQAGILGQVALGMGDFYANVMPRAAWNFVATSVEGAATLGAYMSPLAGLQIATGTMPDYSGTIPRIAYRPGDEALGRGAEIGFEVATGLAGVGELSVASRFAGASRLRSVGSPAVRALGARKASGLGAAESAVSPGFTRSYRAVSPAEFDDIMKTGRFNVGPNSVEGKYFADTLEGVVKHGDTLQGAGKYRIVEADLPNNAPSLYTWPNLDGYGPARYIHVDDLNGVTPRPYKGK